MRGHGCGVERYSQFYEPINRRFKIIQRQHDSSFVATKGYKLLPEQWLIGLSHETEILYGNLSIR